MDKEFLSRDKNINSTSEDKEPKKTSSDDIYGDYPEEVRAILRNSNPLRNRNEDAIEKAVKEAAKEELFSRTRIGKDFKFNDSIKEEVKEPLEKVTEKNEAKPEKESEEVSKSDEKEEKEAKAEKHDEINEPIKTDKKPEESAEECDEVFVPFAEDTEKKDTKEVKENIQELSFDDEDDEPVQLVRHKQQKKEFKRNFASKNEEIKILASVNNTEKKENQSEQIFAKRKENFETGEFDDLKKKFAEEKHKNKIHNPLKDKKHNSQFTSREHEKRQKSYQNRKSPELDNFFRAPRKSSAKAVEKNVKLDKGILIVGGVIIILFVILFVRNLTLSAKLEEAQQKVTDFEQLQQDNEQLKLNIVALEEKLTKNGISLTDDTTSGENGGENVSADSGQYDTYTVVSGDTLSGISNKVYGNFSGYKKILEANGLTENSSIQIGQVLKIPKN